MKIAVIGTSGSGKSTVSKFFVEKGFVLIDLDKIGKDVVDIYPELRQELKKEFGEEIFDNGVLNRKKLGEIVFFNSEKLEILNYIFRGFIQEEACKIYENNENVVLDGYTIPNYFEYDFIIGVETDLEIAVQRLQKREPHNSKELFQKRIESQGVPKWLFNYVIENNGTEQELNIKLKELFEKII